MINQVAPLPAVKSVNSHIMDMFTIH